jgi:hypothetical protein
MNVKNNIIKTTCNRNIQASIIPIPAKVIAGIANVSESYVKKIRTGLRSDTSEKAQKVRFCESLMVDGSMVLINAVNQTINKF